MSQMEWHGLVVLACSYMLLFEILFNYNILKAVLFFIYFILTLLAIYIIMHDRVSNYRFNISFLLYFNYNSFWEYFDVSIIGLT